LAKNGKEWGLFTLDPHVVFSYTPRVERQLLSLTATENCPVIPAGLFLLYDSESESMIKEVPIDEISSYQA